MTTRTATAAPTATVVLSVVSGPDLAGFLSAALKNSSAVATFMVVNPSRVQGAQNMRLREVKVTITDATCEDGSGLRFIFGGTRVGSDGTTIKRLAGYYDTKSKSGNITLLS